MMFRQQLCTGSRFAVNPHGQCSAHAIFISDGGSELFGKSFLFICGAVDPKFKSHVRDAASSFVHKLCFSGEHLLYSSRCGVSKPQRRGLRVDPHVPTLRQQNFASS